MNNTLTNHTINDILYKLIDKYDGCYMSNQGKFIKNNKYYLYNLNNSFQNGSHWVSLYKNNNKSY